MKLVLCSPSHFTDEKSKAQKGEVMSQRLQLSEVAQGLEYRPLDQVLPLLFTGASVTSVTRSMCICSAYTVEEVFLSVVSG